MGSLAVGVLVGVAAGVEDVGVGDCVGAATEQVTTGVFVYTGCADVSVATAGAGVALAGEVAAALDWSVWVGSAPVTSGSALGWHLAAAECDFAAFDFRDVPGVLPVLPAPPGAGLADDVPVPPSTVRAPLPSVPAVVRCDPLPPCNAVLAWRMAFRNGRTPSVTLAMTATAAKTAASRSVQLPHPGKLPFRNRGHRTSASRDNQPGVAQCPRHVQFRTRSAAPKRTLSNQGRGGRPAIRA